MEYYLLKLCFHFHNVISIINAHHTHQNLLYTYINKIHMYIIK